MDFVSSRSNKLRYSRVQLTLICSRPYLRIVSSLLYLVSRISMKNSSSREDLNWIPPNVRTISFLVRVWHSNYRAVRLHSFCIFYARKISEKYQKRLVVNVESSSLIMNISTSVAPVTRNFLQWISFRCGKIQWLVRLSINIYPLNWN